MKKMRKLLEKKPFFLTISPLPCRIGPHSSAWIEQQPSKLEVDGSNPSAGTIFLHTKRERNHTNINTYDLTKY